MDSELHTKEKKNLEIENPYYVASLLLKLDCCVFVCVFVCLVCINVLGE